jgi:outer membrane protein
MKKNIFGILSLIIAATLALTAVAKAEDVAKSNDDTKTEEVKHYRVGLRALYVYPTESFDKKAEEDTKSKLSLSNNFTPCADLEYFFTNQISTELIAGVTKHTIKSNGNEIGSTYLLPPSITLKYHPFGDAKFSPYLGAGIEMTFPFNDKLNNGNKIRIDASIGYALQTGIDIKVDNHLYLNVDYKYLNADTRFRISDAGPWYKLDMNPHVFGVGVGYRF